MLLNTTNNIKAHIVLIDMPLLNTRKHKVQSVHLQLTWYYRYYHGLLRKNEIKIKYHQADDITAAKAKENAYENLEYLLNTSLSKGKQAELSQLKQ